MPTVGETIRDGVSSAFGGGTSTGGDGQSQRRGVPWGTRTQRSIADHQKEYRAAGKQARQASERARKYADELAGEAAALEAGVTDELNVMFDRRGNPLALIWGPRPAKNLGASARKVASLGHRIAEAGKAAEKGGKEIVRIRGLKGTARRKKKDESKGSGGAKVTPAGRYAGIGGRPVPLAKDGKPRAGVAFQSGKQIGSNTGWKMREKKPDGSGYTTRSIPTPKRAKNGGAAPKKKKKSRPGLTLVVNRNDLEAVRGSRKGAKLRVARSRERKVIRDMRADNLARANEARRQKFAARAARIMALRNAGFTKAEATEQARAEETRSGRVVDMPRPGGQGSLFPGQMPASEGRVTARRAARTSGAVSSGGALFPDRDLVAELRRDHGFNDQDARRLVAAFRRSYGPVDVDTSAGAAAWADFVEQLPDAEDPD